MGRRTVEVDISVELTALEHSPTFIRVSAVRSAKR
jgi:hypothetical protein